MAPRRWFCGRCRMREAVEHLVEAARRAMGSPGHRQRGQALIIFVFAIFGLLVVAGLGVDLGLFYIERVRITRAVDAAALAAAAELPLEEAAQQRALEFLVENGYDATDPTTRVVINGQHISGPSEEAAATIIELDTASFRDLDLPPEHQLNSAYRIQVLVRQDVPVIFLRFINFIGLQAAASATAENINNLDIVIVFDRSGSMEFDTLCYGCWRQINGVPYPGGNLYPLPWNGPADGPPEHCGPTQYYAYGGYRYYFIEAEEYSRLSNPYDRFLYQPYYTYWVMQREPNDGASGRDSRGAYLLHMPFPDYEEATGYGVTCREEDVVNGWCNSNVTGGPFPAPRADYDFTPPEDGNYYIWVRGQAANSWSRHDGLDRRLFWGIDGAFLGTEGGFRRGTGYNGASSSRWQWRRLNGTPFFWNAGETHTLNLWAGGSNFAVDRIVITTNPYGSDGSPPSGPINWNSGRGAAHWANGRTDWACNPCDARFAGHPGQTGYREYEPNCSSGPNPDRRYDDVWDDEQPIRTAIEAAKRFVGMLDPRYDQIGYVRYSSNSTIASELQCLRRLGPEYCTSQVITDTVVAALDATYASGATNIAGGMEDGIAVLSTGTSAECQAGGHCGRPGAAHVMIVMTDGRANQRPNSYCDDDPARQWPGGSAAQDCVIYYAHEARENSIVVYTITLGGSADFELMEAVADITGGVHRNADRPEKLNEIFEELYERIFLRLVD
ncbi:MAG TPA: VWA domain-containing protein [Anaerolineales bacterium]|nr:VWA domain-containing protein [Anaerolineales bacterium]